MKPPQSCLSGGIVKNHAERFESSVGGDEIVHRQPDPCWPSHQVRVVFPRHRQPKRDRSRLERRVTVLGILQEKREPERRTVELDREL